MSATHQVCATSLKSKNVTSMAVLFRVNLATGSIYYCRLFRAEGKIKHCRIKHEGRLFTIGNAQFESLVELVEFYTRRPLYKGMKLRFPCSEEVC